MKNTVLVILIFTLLTGVTISCKKFIEIDPPKNILVPASVFANDDLSTAAMLGIYNEIVSQAGFASGDDKSLSTYAGLSSDEFLAYSPTLLPLFNNQLTPETSPTNVMWQKLYKTVYDVNSILEGLEDGNGVTPPVKAQLQGEAYFMRAFCYFYLVNLYGEVPVHLTTDYAINSKASKMPTGEVYARVITDLKQAEILLNENYVTTERVRPNKAAAQALLARTYLHIGDWPNAERCASLVIARNSVYRLIAPDQVFLKNSQESIWQLFPPVSAGNSWAGNKLIPTTGSTVPIFVSLYPNFVEQKFEKNDLRKISWIRSFVGNGVTYYYPFKYKVRSSSIVTEYFMVFRLAEQLLIRSEARAQQNNLSGAIDDLDAIRGRAGLTLLKNVKPDISRENLLSAIQNERSVELFTEWGDRWLNLKRTSQANAVLAPIKFNWKPEFLLYPIPSNEVSKNRNIIQNDGY